MEENQRKIEEQQKKMVSVTASVKINSRSFAWIQAEERLKMIEEQMKIEEEKLKFKRREEKKVKNEQKKILGKDNSRPKLSFAIMATTNWINICKFLTFNSILFLTTCNM